MKVAKYLTKENLSLLIIAVLSFFSVFSQLEFKPTEELMFLFPDSKTYLEVGNWMIGNANSESVDYALSVRPFLYPLIVIIAKSLGGFWFLWFLHFLFWVLTFFLVFKSVKLMAHVFWAWLAAIAFLFNVSPIAATYHALTESIILMLFSYLFYLIIKKRNKLFELITFHKILLTLVLLTLIKPVFFIPTVAILLFGLILHLKKYFSLPKNSIVMMLILLPLIAQIAFIKVNYNAFNVSTIGSYTLKNYLVAQSYQLENNIYSLSDARKKVNEMDDDEYQSWILDNTDEIFSCVKNNLKENLFAFPVFLSRSENGRHQTYVEYMQSINAKIYKIHKLVFYFSLPILAFLFLFLKKEDAYVFLLGALFLMYFILTTGISFYQGDRLVLPAWGVTLIIYTLLGATFVRAIKSLILKYSKYLTA